MMKKRWRTIAAAGMIISLVFSNIAYAGEIVVQNGENYFETGAENLAETMQAVEEQAVESESETDQHGAEPIESETTEAVESHVYILQEPEQTETENAEEGKLFDVQKIEEKNFDYLIETPKTTVLVFQPERLWEQTVQESGNEAETEEKSWETESNLQETQENLPLETQTESYHGIILETQNEDFTKTSMSQTSGMETLESMSDTVASESESRENLPVVALSSLQKLQVRHMATKTESLVIIMNGCRLEDELIFQDTSRVKAVLSGKAETEEKLVESLQNIDFSDIFKEYESKVAEAKKQREEKLVTLNPVTGTSRSISTGIGSSLNGTQSTDSTNSTNSTNSTGMTYSTNSSESTYSTNSSESTYSTSSTDSTSSTGSYYSSTSSNAVTFTYVPEEFLNTDEYIGGGYEIYCEKEITDCTVTITFDATKLTLTEAEASDAFDDYDDITIKEVDVKSTEAQGGKIVFSFSSKTPVKLDGEMIYFYLDLKEKAKTGDSHYVRMAVNELKNGSVSYNPVTDVTIKEEPNIAVADPDAEEESQTASETSTSSTSSTSGTVITSSTSSPSSTGTIYTAAKTGDDTNVWLWIAPMAIATMAIVIVVAGKNRKKKTGDSEETEESEK